MPTTADLLKTVTGQLDGGGEERPGQLQMATEVAKAAKQGKTLLVEAGTGTGKSLAYLIPVIAAGKTTVVATATIALQGQLVDHDVELVAAGLNRHVDVVLLKGRSNYLCQQRLAEFQRSNQQEQLQLLRGQNPGNLDDIIAWAEETETGDREELDPAPPADTWRAVSVGPDECPGAHRCPSGATCFSELARAEAAEADVVVTNHHYYGLDLASDGALLPEHDVVVLDEAHHFGEVVGATNGTEISGSRFRGLARRVRGVSTDDALVASIERTANDLDSLLASQVGDQLGNSAELVSVLLAGRENIQRSLETLRKAQAAEGSDAAAKVERATLTCTRFVVDIDIVVELSEADVLWVDGTENYPTLRRTPLDVGGILTESLWGERAVIMTSATLPDGIVPSLGLDPDRNEVVRVGSPFDYDTQGLLYCAAHLPDPRSRDYRKKVAEEMAQLIDAAGGRTLSLFTSFTALNETAELLESRVDYPLLIQGSNSRRLLLEQFRSDPRTVLLATRSFWQGVDIAGPSLTLVTIDRLPFPRPDEPVHQARRDKAGRFAFATVDLPIVQTLLAQGVGRLIRRSKDYGVVAVFDSRLATKKAYRWDLIHALPPFRRTRKVEEAAAFLQKLDH